MVCSRTSGNSIKSELEIILNKTMPIVNLSIKLARNKYISNRVSQDLQNLLLTMKLK